MKQLLHTFLFVAVLAICASSPFVSLTLPCSHETNNIFPSCPTSHIPLPYGTFGITPPVTPLMDGTGLLYGDPDGNRVSLYGIYGSIENNPQYPLSAQAHYNLGLTQGSATK